MRAFHRRAGNPEAAMYQESSAAYFHDQADRCRRLAAQVMDRLMETRLLAAAQTFDELARNAMQPAVPAAEEVG